MSEKLLDVQHLSHCFRLGKQAVIKAVDDVSFQINRGEIFGLVGEFGSGKSTVARCVMNIYQPTDGKVVYQGIDTCDPKQFKANRTMLQTTRQLIFQDSSSSLNQRMKISEIVVEPMKINHIKPPRGTYRDEAACQRVAIARALAMEPALLVADEPIASLDVSIQAQIINLFKHLQAEHGFSILFIAHDLSVVRYLCDRVGVMYAGKLVEVAPTEELFANPLHPYTKALLSAIPIPDPRLERARKAESFMPEEVWREGTLVEVLPGHQVLMREGGREK